MINVNSALAFRRTKSTNRTRKMLQISYNAHNLLQIFHLNIRGRCLSNWNGFVQNWSKLDDRQSVYSLTVHKCTHGDEVWILKTTLPPIKNITFHSNALNKTWNDWTKRCLRVLCQYREKIKTQIPTLPFGKQDSFKSERFRSKAKRSWSIYFCHLANTEIGYGDILSLCWKQCCS